MFPQTMFPVASNPECPCPPTLLVISGDPEQGDTIVFNSVTNTWEPSDTLVNITLVNSAEQHQTLLDGPTINWDMNLGGSAQVTLGGNRTFAAPTNIRQGATYMLAVIQGAGANTITWNSVFKWPGGTAPTLSAGAGDKDIIAFWSYDGVNLYGVANNDFS